MSRRQLHVQLPVVLVTASTNFVRLPASFAQTVRSAVPAKSQGVVALRLGWLGPPTAESGGLARPCQAFVGWTDATASGHYLELPVGLAEALGIKTALDAATAMAPDSPLVISVAVVPFAPVAARVEVDPATADDWDILQMHAHFVEDELLSQISVLGPGQRFPMWVHGHIRINMQVSNIALVEQGQALCVRLARNTEVLVAPKLRSKDDQHRQQSLRQRELEGSAAAQGLRLRVQPIDLEAQHGKTHEGQLQQPSSAAAQESEEDWNGIAAVHATTIARLERGAGWPPIKQLENGDLVYKDDPSRPLIVMISNERRVRLAERARKSKRVSLKPAQGLMSVLHEEHIRLRVSNRAAPGHVMLPCAVQVRCKVNPLEAVVVRMPRFEPRPCPEAFPALSVRLTAIQGQDEAQAEAACPDDDFGRDASLAAQLWQRRMMVIRPGGGVSAKSPGMGPAQGAPIADGSIIALHVRGGNGMTRRHSDGRVVHFMVRVSERNNKNDNSNGSSGSGSGGDAANPQGNGPIAEKKRVLEPVHWLVTPSSKIEWQVEKFMVDIDLQRITASVGGSILQSDEAGDDETNKTAGASSSSVISGGGGGSGGGSSGGGGNGKSASGADKAIVERVRAGGVGCHLSGYFDQLSLQDLGGYASYGDTALERLRPVLRRAEARNRLALGGPHPGGVYLCGGRGAGKTTLAQAVAKALRCDVDGLVHTVWVSCANLRGGKRSEVESSISSAFNEALRTAPALIVFDDLDLLLPTPAGGDGGGGGGEDAQLVWLVEWIEDLCTQYQRKLEAFERVEMQSEESLEGRSLTHRAVSWLATGREKGSLRKSLQRPGLFDRIVEIQPLTAHDRTLVLEAQLQLGGCSAAPDLDLDEVAAQAEGYAPADLNILVERALHESLQDLLRRELESSSDEVGDEVDDKAETPTGISNGDDPVPLCQVHFDRALDGFTPAALRGVALAKSDVKWDDVGGLHTVRRTLKETLELPIQFAPLYERSPQRLASGILLYGPPGCGKTMLAGAVAKECGLNFISVKGPEVLNKYIGASEQAVRDLFARGAAAAPCVVFFDEFDAVAPRRGNDSSGVTDRVVNQLLTFLDGVETRSGVYVMAATSRPDLVDPALLRPGRLDKQLLCGFPDAEEREDILRAVAAKMPLDESARQELPRVARAPEAELFTGADLQAILYSAQLDAIHADLDAPSSSADDGEDESKDAQDAPAAPRELLVGADHVRKALQEARPSVSREERERFTRIYDAFKGDRGADFNAVSGYPDGKQRTALK
ncbi:26S proteasome regulatory subunit 6B [Hondaea fermentalgiana]|uniref:Peroxisomal ATPase PEX1 n=1 Tax=Hondaea fermentalgiana TaxID=2315210 RepID=A0A2R5GY34_9STRA|nr:26S proteasome regulatory subunit 6B [Hondaea fermentalgiana]|eukprot:GBG32884.1 26S proteasome regulatory subunit 6B [Hondaea fermentalgiana]